MKTSIESHQNSPIFRSFEEINEEVFLNRVVKTNKTSETFNGKHIKYYVTDTGDWHLDSCTVIGHESIGLIGMYFDMSDEMQRRRRLNPYTADSNGLGTWEGGTVPYVIEHPSLNMQNWNAAVDHYNSVSPIRLVDYTNAGTRPKYYIRVFQGSGCYGTLGRVHEYWTRQPDYKGNSLSLGQGCDGWLPTIVHEIGHNLGLHHTQMRSDRDNYIWVYYNNIRSQYHDQYDKTDLPVCGEYDCGSVMHYFDTAFGNGNGKTMVAKNPNTCEIARNSGEPLTYWDKYCLCQLYPPGTNGNPSDSCGSQPTTQYPTTKAPTTKSPTTKTPTTATPTSSTTSTTSSQSTTTTTTTTSTTTQTTTQDSSSFCLRGRGVAGVNLDINGRYIKQDYVDFNGNMYFKKKSLSCQLNTFVYKYDRYYYNKVTDAYVLTTVWAINRELNAGAPIALCMETDVFDCDQKWIFGNQYDTDLRLSRGDCPRVPCDLVTLSGTQTNCDGEYTEVNENTYYKNGYYLIYNDFFEQFRCVETANRQYIDGCDEYDGIKQSEYGQTPDLSNLESYVTWSGAEGTIASLKCVESTTTTTTTTTRAPRQTISCGQQLKGTLAQSESLQFDFEVDTTYYAYLFYTCYPSQEFANSLSVKTQNLISTIATSDYTESYCSKTPYRMSIVLWTKTSQNGKTYALDLSGDSAKASKHNVDDHGAYRVGLYCFASQSDALNFGKDSDGNYIGVFSFKAYGKVQWAIFFVVLIAIIIVNVLIIWFIVHTCLKKKKKEWESKAEQMGLNNGAVQTNIQLSNDDRYNETEYNGTH